MSLVLSQLTISCSSDNDETKTETEQTLAEQIANLIKQPYSSLKPADQKIKLEAEANEMLVQLDKSKSSGAIEAMENLNNLLSISSVDVFSGKNQNQIEDIINTADVYGIYTWDNTKKTWNKTDSTTELKFSFPATKTETKNNAVFSSKGVASNIKVGIEDTYDWETDVTTNDYFFLPTSADATLTINNLPAASFTQTAKYANGKEIPTDFAYKVTLNDGYSWEMSGSKATTNTSKASFTYNGKNLVEFNAGSTTQIDALIDNAELVEYRGKANGLIQLMDNFIIVADMDLVELAKGEETVNKNFQRPDSKTKTFYTDLNNYLYKSTEALALNSNKNLKLILVSKKDGTKIADVIYRLKPGYSLNTSEYESWVVDASNVEYGGSWVFDWNNGEPKGTSVKIQEYDQVLFLKFNDATEVEMSAYFSEGFDKLEAKFNDFIKAFNKQ